MVDLMNCESKATNSVLTLCVFDCLCREAEATMYDCGPIHGLPGRLQTAGPAGGDERPAPGE